MSRLSPGPCRVTGGFHEHFVFCRPPDRHGGKSLLSLCTGPEPMSFGYLAREKSGAETNVVTAVRARVVQIEREHARLRRIHPIAAAQRKCRPTPKGAHVSRLSPGASRVTGGFHEHFVFCRPPDRHGNGTLLSLCSGPEPVSFGYLAMREKRRGNQHCCWRSRANC